MNPTGGPSRTPPKRHEDAPTVPAYFASDMHLRLDYPERGRRLAAWVETLQPDDRLYLVGDVWDCWFGSRQRRRGVSACEGLSALAAYTARGGSLTILPGNHDCWLGPFYEKELGARFVQEPYSIEEYGQRLCLIHGHRVGGRQPWKAGMETRAFLNAFERLPNVVAGTLDRVLTRTNDEGRIRDEQRLIPFFREHLARVPGPVDLVVFGHVHSPLDDRATRPRMVILGGWHHGGSYLRVDEGGAELVVIPRAKSESLAGSGRQPSLG